MSLDILLAFCTYAIVTSITPGPTNFMLGGFKFQVQRG